MASGIHMYEPKTSHCGVMRPVMSTSNPVVWRWPDSKNWAAAESGSVLRSLYLVDWNMAKRVLNILLALSSLAPISMLRLCSGGVLALLALYE